MPSLILVALSDQDQSETLAKRIAEIDPESIVIVTEDLPDEATDTIISLVGDLAKQPQQG